MDNSKIIVGFDMGTSGLKCAAVELPGGRVRSIYQEWELLTPEPGYAEFDCDTIWRCIVNSFVRLRDEYGIDNSRVAAIGFCALCPGLIAVDDEGRELGRCIIFMDARSGKQADNIGAVLPYEKAFAVVGNRIMPGASSVTTMMWLRENQPELYRRTRYFMHLPGWAGYKLTGNVRMDLSNAAGTGLYDIHAQRWSSELIDMFGLDADKLPPLAGGCELLGGVVNPELLELGIREGTPVSCGAGDTVSALLAIAGDTRHAMLSLGTSHVLYSVSDSDRFSPQLMARSYVYRDRWAIGGAMSNPGSMLRWFRDNFCRDLIDRAAELNVDAYSLIDDEAAQCPIGSGGLICLPYINGERTPVYDASARAVFFGVNLHTDRAAVSRAVMEGAGYGIRQILEMLESLKGFKLDGINVTGGGSRSDFLVQTIADITGREMSVVRLPDAGAAGAALTGAMAGGLLKKGITPSFGTVEKHIEPNLKNAGVYDELYAKYLQLYPSLKHIF